MTKFQPNFYNYFSQQQIDVRDLKNKLNSERNLDNFIQNIKFDDVYQIDSQEKANIITNLQELESKDKNLYFLIKSTIQYNSHSSLFNIRLGFLTTILTIFFSLVKNDVLTILSFLATLIIIFSYLFVWFSEKAYKNKRYYRQMLMYFMEAEQGIISCS